MAQKYKENLLYKGLTGAAYGLGASLPSRKKSVDIDRFKNIPRTTPTADTPVAPGMFKNLGAVTTPYGGRTKFEPFHPGVDVAGPGGTPIPAFAGGTVSKVVSGQGWTPGQPSFGNYVIVTDPQGGKHRYSHLSQSYVELGETISKGEIIGPMGKTGGSYSPSGGDPSHLDFRIRDAYGKYVNPLIYLSQLTK